MTSERYQELCAQLDGCKTRKQVQQFSQRIVRQYPNSNEPYVMDIRNNAAMREVNMPQ